MRAELAASRRRLSVAPARSLWMNLRSLTTSPIGHARALRVSPLSCNCSHGFDANAFGLPARDNHSAASLTTAAIAPQYPCDRKYGYLSCPVVDGGSVGTHSTSRWSSAE